MFGRIAWHLTFSHIIVILFSMGILGFYMVKNLEEDYLQELKHNIRQQALDVGGTWAGYLEDQHVNERDKRKLWQIAQRLAWQSGSRICVFNHTHKVIVDTLAVTEPDLANRPAIARAFGGEEQWTTEPDATDPHLTRISFANPIRVRKPSVKSASGAEDTVQGVVLVSRSTAYMHSMLQRLRGLFVFGTAISLILSGTLSLFLSHYISQPLREMAAAADKMAHGDLSIEVTTSRHDEIGELGERFNFMAKQLRASTSLLMEEKNKLTAVLSNMADGVLMLDAAGEIILSNPSAQQMLAFRPNSDERDPLTLLRAELKAVLQSGEETSYEVPLSGSKIARAIYSPVRSEVNEMAGVVVILHDITELRRLAELKTEFVSNVSHELKTPLASIKGLAEILLDGALKEKDGQRFLVSIGREVDRMARLVKDLLSLSKIESGVIKMEVRPFDLAALVREVTSNLQPHAHGHRFQIEVVDQRRHDDHVWAMGDADKVEQVLVNLLDNAIRYSPSDSVIQVRTNRMEDVCQVDVIDQGIGIPQFELERIFQRFYRVDKARSREKGGTGLGLAIARQIVERLQGRIWASSDGHGSTFSFTLPTAQQDIIPAAEARDGLQVESSA